MFPDSVWHTNEDDEVYLDRIASNASKLAYVVFNLDWWNALYKRYLEKSTVGCDRVDKEKICQKEPSLLAHEKRKEK